jgi:MoaA/NifB/PqqE/SkfB family radical SAM enzyme
MANLSLTASCNRACSFCFAADAMESHEGATYMPLEVVESSLDFLTRSHIPEARLLGGEPTIHPDFDRIVDRALERGFRLLVFSGGLIPPRALRKLEAIPEHLLSVLINVIPPDGGKASEIARQEEVFRRLGRRVILGITIDSPSLNLGFLLDLIERFDLGRTVRLGLAHPILEGGNSYLHPRYYPEVGKRTTEFGLAAERRGVRLSFDCGWVPCMFPEGAMDALGVTANEVGLRCNPILDLLPDGKFISCYPLATHATVPLPLYDDAAAVRAAFISRQESDRQFMLYKDCETCDWRARGECTGGCLSASLRRVRRRPFAVEVPDAH